MTIVFYRAPMSSAIPVASVLSELQVPHEAVQFDLSKGDQRKADFLKLNPNGKVPTLVVDGTPIFEALAIMQWLGDRYGVAAKLWPAADDPGRLTALSWSTWTYVTFGGAIQQLSASSSPRSPEALHHQPLADHARQNLDQLLGLLNDRLRENKFMLGDQFSVLDIIVASTVLWGTYCGVSVDAFSAVHAWLNICKERPSIRDAWL